MAFESISHTVPVHHDPPLHLHCVSHGPVDGTPVVLVHGWPDIGLTWRRQLPALAAAGCRALAIDLLGFGGSSCPSQVEFYTFKSFVGYLRALLRFFNAPRAVFVGHDWGGTIVWQMALHAPECCLGVATLCTPFRPPTKTFASNEMIAAKMPYFQYQVYFAR